MTVEIYAIESNYPEQCIEEVEGYIDGDHDEGTIEKLFLGDDRNVFRYKTKYCAHALVVMDGV